MRNVTAVPIGTVTHGDHPRTSTPTISSAKSASVPAYRARVGQATGGTRSPGSGSPETGSGCAGAGEGGAVDMGLQIVEVTPWLTNSPDLSSARPARPGATRRDPARPGATGRVSG